MHGIAGMSAREIRDIFEEETQKAGGTLRKCSNFRGWFYGRSVLPRLSEIMPGDQVQAGVEIKATQRSISVCPSIFRLVCSNGTIVTEQIPARDLSDTDTMAHDDIVWKLRKSVQECCKEEVFGGVVATLRRATNQHVGEVPGNLLQSVALFRLRGRLATEIARRFNTSDDRSRYGLMNAVTSVARDSDDPDLRWNLEKLGGDVAFTRVLIPTREQTCQVAAA